MRFFFKKEKQNFVKSNKQPFEDLFGTFKLDPFSYIDVCAVHTGKITFKVGAGDEVFPASGEWLQIPGTALYEINRERNSKRISASTDGIVDRIHGEFDGQFVEAGKKLMTIKHPLKKKEIIEKILKDVLVLFPAPETAAYSFSSGFQPRIEQKGAKAVTIETGEELFTMSLMRRDTPVYYEGGKGVIHAVYFKPGVLVAQGDPLVGVCTPDKLPLIQKIVTRVKAEWDKDGSL